MLLCVAIDFFWAKNTLVCFICWFLLYVVFFFFFSHQYILLFAINDRKKKAVHKTTTTDDKRLQSTLKRIGVNAIPAIEEVNIFKDDVVIQFINPKGDAILTECRPSIFNPHFHVIVILIIDDVSFMFQFKPPLLPTHGLSVVLLKQRVCICILSFYF